MEPWRAILLQERDREVNWILKIQKLRNPFLDKYFKISSMLGEEIFYILFLPLSAWVMSAQFTVHITMLLAMSVGIGNILKNILRIPRPSHPPVWVHSGVSEKDHGLPSTHTLTAVTLPWYFIIFQDYLEPAHTLPSYLYLIAIVWTFSVSMSRVYNGHHSPIDVMAGAILGIIFLGSWTFQLRPIIDSFIVDNTYTGVFTLIGLGVTVLALHPLPKILTPAHSETGLVAGTATGTFLGLWFRVANEPRTMYALFSGSHVIPQYSVLMANPMIIYLLRFIVGVVIVATARAVVKKVATLTVLRVVDSKYSKTGGFKYTDAECAVKYITYNAIGFSALWLAPVIFTFVGLHMPLDDIIITKS